MAKKIYIGNMIQDLQSSIADLQTDIGTMSTDMASVVAELINVKEAIGQSISVLNTKTGTTHSIVINDTDIIHNTNTITTKKSLVSKANGFINFAGTFESTLGASSSLYYRINGGADIKIAGPTTSSVSFNEDITIADNDLLELRLQTTASGGGVAKVVAGSTISYDIVDLVNDGAIIV